MTGGARPVDLARGRYYAPTVFADADPDSRLAQLEVFGPVVAVLPFDGDDEAVPMADDTDYGLAGSVCTRDQGHGLAVARKVNTGTIGVGGWTPWNTAPFGGRKASGLGHEFGPRGVRRLHRAPVHRHPCRLIPHEARRNTPCASKPPSSKPPEAPSPSATSTSNRPGQTRSWSASPPPGSATPT
ncbi:aldehyde dehydrogenase family protein [Streptomyces capitiformicae]|uniref:aldehyde dehydrogenase family protein n=1 Tax=Streptomyces capitiformicae TaxID=2014920 RepID=UPI001E5582A2|nr:aldehyde dehydrogenase family protein [Streptomyces capitiformicae]